AEKHDPDHGPRRRRTAVIRLRRNPANSCSFAITSVRARVSGCWIGVFAAAVRADAVLRLLGLRRRQQALCESLVVLLPDPLPVLARVGLRVSRAPEPGTAASVGAGLILTP